MAEYLSDRFDLKLDESAAQKGYYLLSSVINATELNRNDVYEFVTEGTLAGIAVKAHQEMRRMFKPLVTEFANRSDEKLKSHALRMSRRDPTTLTALYTCHGAGSNIILASSARKSDGQSLVYLFPPEERARQFILQSLELADLYVEGGVPEIVHDHSGNCAEVVALHLWAATNSAAYVYTNTFSIVTVKQSGGVKEIFAPCNPMGCENILRSLALQDVRPVVPVFDLFSTQGGTTSSEDIPLVMEPDDMKALKLRAVHTPSITQSSPGFLYIACGGRCGGTGFYSTLRGSEEECYCTMHGNYSTWFLNERQVKQMPYYQPIRKSKQESREGLELLRNFGINIGS